MKSQNKTFLKKIPRVDNILELVKERNFSKNVHRNILLNSTRQVLDNLREKIISGSFEKECIFSQDYILNEIKKIVNEAIKPNLVRVINATGVVIHTNLGRSYFSPQVIENIKIISENYSNLEFDLKKGKRGSRYSCVEGIICELTNAESAIVVNNNAAAVLLSLNTLAKEREVIISRGELVEIGGSFRMPDVMENSNSILKEIGTTNRTHLKDYENAINENTGLLLKVHTSNYGIVGFTSSVPLKDIVMLGKKYGLPVMEDIGSGTLIDLSKYGLFKEPTVQEIIKTGVDIATFSGDKLLGGPQAGIIIGKKKYIEKIKCNSLNRALRIDKMTLAALEATLRLYQDESYAIKHIPTLSMIIDTIKDVELKVKKVFACIKNLNNSRITYNMLNLSSCVGGGAMPVEKIKTCCIGMQIQKKSCNQIYNFFKNQDPPIIGRIENNMFIMDFRTIKENEIPFICRSIKECMDNN